MYAETTAVWLTWTSSGTTAAITDQPYLLRTYETSASTLTIEWRGWVAQQEETAEQRLYRQQADEAARVRLRDIAAVRQAAADRAERLLDACLSSAQRDQLRHQGAFEVRGRSGRVFQVRRGRVRNVVEIATRRTYCCHPIDGVPDADTMLAQKLMIETQEDEFLRLANVS